MPAINDQPFVFTVLPNGIGAANNILQLSICVNINQAWKGFDTESDGYRDGINDFYKKLRQLHNHVPQCNLSLTHPTEQTINLEFSPMGNSPFACYTNNTAAVNSKAAIDAGALLRDLLFPSKTINANATPPIYTKEDVVSMFGENDTERNNILSSTNFFVEKIGLLMENKIGDLDIPTNNKLHDNLSTISSVAKTKAISTRKEKYLRLGSQNKEALNLAIANLVSSTNTSKEFETSSLELIKLMETLESKNMESYLKGGQVDLDEVVASFTALSAYPFLMRLMGYIVDIKVVLPDNYVPSADHTSNGQNDTIFNLLITPKDQSLSMGLVTGFRGIKKNGKYAYLVTEGDNFHHNTILNDKDCELLRTDRVAMEQKLKHQLIKAKENGQFNSGEAKDAFTRGIAFTHLKLKELVSSADPTDPANPLSSKILGHGYRVAVRVDNALPASLTVRKIQLTHRPADGNPQVLFSCGSMESCIHIDSAMGFIKDGRPANMVGDTLFLYSGELLNLKSAFSKYNRISKMENEREQDETAIEEGYKKSLARSEEKLSMHYFPFNELKAKKDVHIDFDIPEEYAKGGPRLRFNKTYQFVLYQEYINGYALPLNSPSESLQLSITDLADFGSIKKMPFFAAENEKPPIMLHTSTFETGELEDKQSLHQLMIRSSTANDNSSTNAARHLLPERIPMEHAFWGGLISPNRISADASYEWKRKYSCPFKDKNAYEEFLTKGDTLKEKPRRCPESCRAYCGGTNMKPFYTDNFIQTNYIPDPSVDGAVFRFYWDKEYKHELKPELIALFEDGDMLRKRSIRFRLLATNDNQDMVATLNAAKNTVTIRIKKGIQLYVKISNNENESISIRNDGSKRAYWWEDYGAVSAQITTLAKDSDEIFQLATLTHAVKLPLVTPSIKQLYSNAPNGASTAHLHQWFPRYNNEFAIDQNIIALREAVPGQICRIGSQLAILKMVAHFERLDAFQQDKFLDDVIPTGGLELWVRREEYRDDPEIIVLSDRDSVHDHFPESPVVPFSGKGNKKNEFKL